MNSQLNNIIDILVISFSTILTLYFYICDRYLFERVLLKKFLDLFKKGFPVGNITTENERLIFVESENRSQNYVRNVQSALSGIYTVLALIILLIIESLKAFHVNEIFLMLYFFVWMLYGLVYVVNRYIRLYENEIHNFLLKDYSAIFIIIFFLLIPIVCRLTGELLGAAQ
jgi:hypothetical protein